MMVDLRAFPRFLRQCPLFLQGRQISLSPLQLFAKLHHLPFLGGDGPQEVVAIVLDVEGNGSPRGERRGGTS